MNGLVQRVVNLLKAPGKEWPVIAGEPSTIQSLFVPYALILAAIGPVALLLGGGAWRGVVFGGGFLLRVAITSYAISLISVVVLAFIINALAPTFGGQKDTLQSFKTAVYASTASWLAGIGYLLWFLGSVVMLAGAAYSVYLLYMGLPHTMKAPADKAVGYTAVVVVAAIVVFLIAGALSGGGVQRGAFPS